MPHRKCLLTQLVTCLLKLVICRNKVDCHGSVNKLLSALVDRIYFPADVIQWTKRRLAWTRRTCSDVTVTSWRCGRCYDDVIMRLVTWHGAASEGDTSTDQLHEIWVKMDTYKQLMLSAELKLIASTCCFTMAGKK